MVLKRVSMPHKLGGGGEGIISRTASGLSLDFPLGDPAVYFAGTEDGTVHKCSWSYNEQYLETYFGHTGTAARSSILAPLRVFSATQPPPHPWPTAHGPVCGSLGADGL